MGCVLILMVCFVRKELVCVFSLYIIYIGVYELDVIIECLIFEDILNFF